MRIAIFLVFIVCADAFRHNNGIEVATASSRQEELTKASRWEQCIWDGPEGSGFRATIALELASERMQCKFTCRGARYEMDSRVMPGFFTHEESEAGYCSCFVAGKKNFGFRKSVLYTECSAKTCWNRYQRFMNYKQPRHRQISFSNLGKLQVSCAECESKETCTNSIKLPTPWSMRTAQTDEQETNGDTIAPDIAKFIQQEGLDFVEPTDSIDEVVVEIEDPGHVGDGGETGEIGTLTTDGDSDVTDVEQDTVKPTESDVDHDGEAVGATWQPDSTAVSECLSADSEEKRAACVCGLASSVTLTPAQITMGGMTKLAIVHSMVMATQCGATSRIAFEHVAPWACALHSWTKKCVPVYPTYAPQKPSTNPVDTKPVNDIEGPSKPVAPTTTTSAKPSEESVPDLDPVIEHTVIENPVIEEPITIPSDGITGDVDDDQPAILPEAVSDAVNDCTLSGNSEDIAACICSIANDWNAHTRCDTLSSKVVEFASPWACAFHHELGQCVPAFAGNPGQETKPNEALVEDVNEYGPCGELGSAAWWADHQLFYRSLFMVVQDEDANIQSLRCKFFSKKHACLETRQMAGGDDGFAPTIRTFGKNSIDALTDIPLKCVRGQWVEPSGMELQSCAYPLRPKNLVKAGDPQDKREQERVLTVGSQKGVDRHHKGGSNIEVIQWEPYNLAQLWIMDEDGLIRSAADPKTCLTAEDPHNWISRTSGWLEGYLYTQPCTKYFGLRNGGHEWWITSDFASGIRSNKAGGCAKTNSCCSLSFAAVSGGWVAGEATTGKYFLTFPKAEEEVKDWSRKVYILQQDGSVKEDYLDMMVPVGVLTNEDGTPLRVNPEEVGKRITHNFHLGSEETYPKILKSLKMSDQDMELSVIDFWKPPLFFW